MCIEILCVLLASPVFAAEYEMHIDHCTVAAEEFEVSSSQGGGASALDTVGTLLPVLIMERLSRNMARNISYEERLKDKLYPLRQERVGLFMKLDNAIRERDRVVLLPLTRGARRRRIRAAEKAIKAAKDALDDNLKASQSVIDEENGDIKNGKNGKGEEEGAPLAINIYKDDSSALWKSGVQDAYDTDDKHTSVKYAAAAVESKIDMLITGKVSAREGFLSVSVAVYLYPLSVLSGQVTDVGKVGDIGLLSMRLADAIVPFITNTLPAEAAICVSPMDAAKKAVLSIDDIIYRGKLDTITLSAGLHTLTFTAEGYSPASATYSFTGGKRHNVAVVMQEAEEAVIHIRFDGLDDKNYDKKDYSVFPRTVLSNAVQQGKLQGAHNTSSISVDGKAILGVVLTDGGPPAQFYVPLKLVDDGNMLRVETNVFDRTSYIDKRRRWFYVSYSAFITSLMGAFYTAGRYAAMNGYETQDTLDKWQMARNITAGVSVACGGWMIYELVRYIRAASKVLPAEARAAHYDSDDSMDSSSSDESIQELQSDETLTGADDAGGSAEEVSRSSGE